MCRRAERAVVPLVTSEEVDPEVGVYLNRCVLWVCFGLFVCFFWARERGLVCDVSLSLFSFKKKN